MMESTWWDGLDVIREGHWMMAEILRWTMGPSGFVPNE